MIKDFYVDHLGLILKYIATGLVTYRTFDIYEKRHITFSSPLEMLVKPYKSPMIEITDCHKKEIIHPPQSENPNLWSG